MSSHLEVLKPSGRELIPLNGERVTLGKASTNVVALEHDDTVSRLHAILENLGSAWSIRDVGSRNGTFSTARRSPPNVFCVPATRCASASHGWSIWRSAAGVPVEEATIVPTPPSFRRG